MPRRALLGAAGWRARQAAAVLDTIGPRAIDITQIGTIRSATTAATIVSQINASVAGDTVVIAAGSYASVTVPKNIASGFIRIVPASLGAVSIAGVNLTSSQGLDWRGINTTGEVYYDTCSRIRWRGGTSTPGATLVGHNIRGSCSDVLVEDATVTNPLCGFYLYADRDTNASNLVTIQHNRVNNVAQDHVFFGRGTNVLIEANEFFGNTEDAEHQDGVQIVGGKDAAIRRNHMNAGRTYRDSATDRNDHGIICNYDPSEVGAGGTAGRVPERITIENNLIHDQSSYGIALAGILGCVINNNTIYDNGLSGAEVALSVAPDAGNTISGLEIRNNIFNKMSISGTTPTVNTNNFVADGSGPTGTNRLTGSPGFVNSAAANYALSSGTQNVGSGTATGAPSVDYYNQTRSNPPSRGAIEFNTISGGGGGTTPPTVFGTPTSNYVFNTAVTVNVPTGTTTGHVMYAWLNVAWNTAITTAATGWTLLTSFNQTSGALGGWWYLYRKVASGSEPTNYTWTTSAAQNQWGAIVTVSGANTTTPENVTGSVNSSVAATSHAITAITPTVANTLLLAFYSARNGTATASPYTHPSGMTEVLDRSDNFSGIGIASLSAPTANSTTGTKTVSVTPSSEWGGVLVAIAPA